MTGLEDYTRLMGKESEGSVASPAVDRLKNPAANYTPDNLERFLASGSPVTPIVSEARMGVAR